MHSILLGHTHCEITWSANEGRSALGLGRDPGHLGHLAVWGARGKARQHICDPAGQVGRHPTVIGGCTILGESDAGLMAAARTLWWPALYCDCLFCCIVTQMLPEPGAESGGNTQSTPAGTCRSQGGYSTVTSVSCTQQSQPPVTSQSARVPQDPHTGSCAGCRGAQPAVQASGVMARAAGSRTGLPGHNHTGCSGAPAASLSPGMCSDSGSVTTPLRERAHLLSRCAHDSWRSISSPVSVSLLQAM